MKIIVRIALVLGSVILLMAVTSFFLESDHWLQGYLENGLTEILGIVITISLVEVMLADSRKKEQKEDAKQGILGASKLLNIYLIDYEDAASMLSNPPGQDSPNNRRGVEKNFDFRNLQDLFTIEHQHIDQAGKSKVEIYFDKLDRVLEAVKTIIYQVDLSFYPELSDLLIRYVQYVESFYPKEGIINDINEQFTGKSASEVITKLIAQHNEKVEYGWDARLNRYIRLYKLINFHVDFVYSYRKAMHLIENEEKMRN